ncbi:MAG: arylesterase [Bryocella sp.]
MRRLWICCSVLLMVTLAGCRADRGKPVNDMAEQVSIANPTPPATAYRPTIVCFGDSLTAGYGTDPGESYPDALQKILDANAYPYRVINEGVSGNTTKDALERIGRVIARHPEVVVLEFGGNDGLRGLPLEQTKANLASLIDQLQTAHVKVLLAGITLPPSYGPDYIAKFNAIYPALAKRYKIPYIPFLLKGVFGVEGAMQEDGIHATGSGNKTVAANVATRLAPLLQH